MCEHINRHLQMKLAVHGGEMEIVQDNSVLQTINPDIEHKPITKVIKIKKKPKQLSILEMISKYS
jgi:hypothetical protein